MPKTTLDASASHILPGDTIRKVRRRLGLTLSQVGERTGLAISTLSKLEKGSASMS